MIPLQLLNFDAIDILLPALRDDMKFTYTITQKMEANSSGITVLNGCQHAHLYG